MERTERGDEVLQTLDATVRGEGCRGKAVGTEQSRGFEHVVLLGFADLARDQEADEVVGVAVNLE